MKYYLIIFFIFSASLFSKGKPKEASSSVNHFFELKIDSIERIVMNDMWGEDVKYLLHYSIRNTHSEKMVYVANSCIYANHYQGRINGAAYHFNATGDCYVNAPIQHELAPGESFSENELISAAALDELEPGSIELSLFISLLKDSANHYKVSGESFEENEDKLVFKGKTKFIEKLLDGC